MEYVTLGKTGLKVSKIGLGGIPIQKIDAEGTRILVHKLSDRGVNYIDTARAILSARNIWAMHWRGSGINL